MLLYQSAIVVAITAIVEVRAFWRLQCFGVVGIGRIDPIISPGEVSAHVHTIKGGSGISESTSLEDLLSSSCTSCQIKQDHSAYWTPQLYFIHADGSIDIVPEISGHLTYYKYVPVQTPGFQVLMPEAIPNGFKTTAGDPMQRNSTYAENDNSQPALSQRAIGFNCLNYQRAPEGSLYRHFLPDKEYLEQNCVDGIRMELLFPQCWNGNFDVNGNNRGNLAYPDALLNGGFCPEGYDRNLNQIFFETIYPTQNYIGVDGFYAFSNGDPTGYGYHGDIIIAWDEGVLQNATELCGPVTGFGASGAVSDCPVFELVANSDQASCSMLTPTNLETENVRYGLTSLPGNNPIQSGPGYATMPVSGAKMTSMPSAVTNIVPTLSYSAAASTSDIGIVFLGGTTTIPSPSSHNTPSKGIATTLSTRPTISSTSSNQVLVVSTTAEAFPTLTGSAPPFVGTDWYTSSDVVYEILIVEETIFITDEPAATTIVKNKRDHRHSNRHNRGL